MHALRQSHSGIRPWQFSTFRQFARPAVSSNGNELPIIGRLPDWKAKFQAVQPAERFHIFACLAQTED
jgi:hypothetical protein